VHDVQCGEGPTCLATVNVTHT